MLLLKKKKYAGLMITNFQDVKKKVRNKPFQEIEKMEYKGLDLVRRDWSDLTKIVSKVVLSKLMHDEGLDGINSYLREVNKGLKLFSSRRNSGRINVEDGSLRFNLSHFKIQKQLQKNIKQYSEATSLPHVKVAQDMKRLFRKTDSELVNHYIPYVVTTLGDSLS